MSSPKNDLTLTLSEVTEALNLEKQKKVLAKHWDTSCESYNGDVFFLNEGFIEVYNNYFGFPDYILFSYNKTIHAINSNQHLKMLAWHIHQVLFSYHDDENTYNLLSDWPYLETSLGELSDMFGVVVFVSGIINTLKYYERKGISSDVARDTLDDLLRWINAYHRKTERLGFNEYGWLYLHFTGKLFRFGRLQFESSKFTCKISVYKNNLSNELIVFSTADIRYRQDGQIDGTSGIYDIHNSWVSQFIKKDGQIYGNPISENACCCKDLVGINENEWSIVLNENDMILNIHVPEGMKLDHDLCTKSYNEALNFFQKYFPAINFKAFICSSWLLDIQLKEILNASSNIVQFLSDFYLFPVFSPKEAQAYERVFGEYIDDVNKLSETTFLQKAIKQYIRTGNFMRDGAGFILIN